MSALAPARFAPTAFALAIAAVLAAPAPAAIHKCGGDDGGTTYQDRPCGAQPLDASGVLDAPLSVLPAPSRRSIERAPSAKPPKPERARKAEPPRTADARERRHLHVGMSEGEVLARVGPPDFTTGKGRRATRWTWMPAPADPDTITVVLFETGRVVEVERTVVKR